MLLRLQHRDLPRHESITSGYHGPTSDCPLGKCCYSNLTTISNSCTKNFKIFSHKIFHFKLNCIEERAHACAALANLVLEADAVPSLMGHEIVRRVAPLILDKDEKVQETATGILRLSTSYFH